MARERLLLSAPFSLPQSNLFQIRSPRNMVTDLLHRSQPTIASIAAKLPVKIIEVMAVTMPAVNLQPTALTSERVAVSFIMISSASSITGATARGAKTAAWRATGAAAGKWGATPTRCVPIRAAAIE